MLKKKVLTLKKSMKSSPMQVNDRVKTDHIGLEAFKELHDEFISLKTLEGVAPRTMKDYSNNHRYFMNFLEGMTRSSENRMVDIHLLRSYLNYMVHDMQYKPSTVNVRLRNLKTYLRWLYREKYINDDLSIRLKLMKVPVDTVHPLNDSQVKKMLSAPDTLSYSGYRDFCIMILILDTGIRINECINVKVSDINLPSRILDVRADTSKVRVFRQLPLSSKCSKLLKELISIADDSSCEYVFQSLYGGKMDGHQITCNFRKYGKQMGIKQRCTPHVFRHTFATNFVKGGGDVFTLQKMLGHSTLDMSRRYIQLDNTHLRKKHKDASMLEKYLK